MPSQIALLRAVNVGGRKLAMAELKSMLEALEFTNVRTILQSGSVVFGGAKLAGERLESFLEVETGKRLGLRTDYFVRTTAAWERIIARNSFQREAKEDPSHLLVIALKAEPSTQQVAALRTAVQGREIIRAAGTEIYAYYPDGIGESKLTTALIERKLATRATGRNWNTVLRIRDVMRE